MLFPAFVQSATADGALTTPAPTTPTTMAGATNKYVILINVSYDSIALRGQDSSRALRMPDYSAHEMTTPARAELQDRPSYPASPTSGEPAAFSSPDPGDEGSWPGIYS